MRAKPWKGPKSQFPNWGNTTGIPPRMAVALSKTALELRVKSGHIHIYADISHSKETNTRILPAPNIHMCVHIYTDVYIFIYIYMCKYRYICMFIIYASSIYKRIYCIKTHNIYIWYIYICIVMNRLHTQIHQLQYLANISTPAIPYEYMLTASTLVGQDGSACK